MGVLFYIFILLSLISFVIMILSIKILNYWDFNNTSSYQYKLEKYNYLAQVLLILMFIIELFLLPYTIFTFDFFSNMLHGAMCAAGVVNANIYGNYFLVTLISSIFFIGFFIVINRLDLETINYKFTILKIKLSLVISIFIFIDFALFILFYFNLDLNSVVSCCSLIFGNDIQTLYLYMHNWQIITIFYGLGLMFLISLYFKDISWILLLSFLFLIISYGFIVYIATPYIYQLPTHQCPYCFFAKEYYYVGYLIFGTLLIGSFFAMAGVIEKYLVKKTDYFRYAFINILIFILIVSFYPIYYYFTHGVWL